MSVNIYTKRSNENEALYLKRIESFLKEMAGFSRELTNRMNEIIKIAFYEIRNNKCNSKKI